MKGTYVLFMELEKDLMVEVGRLGIHELKKGTYAYVGSAMGDSVSLENRIKRHKRLAENKKGSRQWHIDYFTTSPGVSITGVVRVNGKAIECQAAKLMSQSGGREIVRGFGSSDCKCGTHFFGLDEKIASDFLRHLPDLF